MVAPALAMGAAGEASGSSFDALSAKMNVLVHLSNILSLWFRDLSDFRSRFGERDDAAQRRSLHSWAQPSGPKMSYIVFMNSMNTLNTY